MFEKLSLGSSFYSSSKPLAYMSRNLCRHQWVHCGTASFFFIIKFIQIPCVTQRETLSTISKIFTCSAWTLVQLRYILILHCMERSKFCINILSSINLPSILGRTKVLSSWLHSSAWDCHTNVIYSILKELH